MLSAEYTPGSAPRQLLKINIPGRHIAGTLNVDTFKDGDFYISYVDAFNLTGYGDTQEEANELLNEVLKDFCEGLFTLTEAQVVKALSGFGWKRSAIFKKEFAKDVHVDKEGILRNFNLPAETKVESHLVTV